MSTSDNRISLLVEWTVVQRRSTVDNNWIESESRGTTADECVCDNFTWWRAQSYLYCHSKETTTIAAERQYVARRVVASV